MPSACLHALILPEHISVLALASLSRFPLYPYVFPFIILQFRSYKLKQASESPADSLAKKFLIKLVCCGAQEFAFLTRPQVMLMLVERESHTLRTTMQYFQRLGPNAVHFYLQNLVPHLAQDSSSKKCY